MRVRIGVLFLLLLGACWAWAEPAAVDAPLARSGAESQALLQKAIAGGRCIATEVKYGGSGTLLRASSEALLPAGRYRAHFLLSFAPLGETDLSAIAITLSANDASRGVGVLHFAKADEFTDLTLDFTAPGGQAAMLNVGWALVGERAKFNHDQAMKSRPVKGPDDEEDINPDLEAPAMAKDGTIAVADLKKLPYHLAACGVFVETLSPIAVTAVTADKIVYKPGEQGTATVTLRNDGATAAQVALAVDVCPGLEGSRPAAQATIALAPGETKTWSGPFETKDLYWGADLRATAKVGDGPAATGRFSFAVTKNFWETAIVTGMMFSRDFIEPAAAEKFMQGHMDEGSTALESGFWAPDEFGNFAPDPVIDIFFGGQGAYAGSVKGTKNVINAGHKRGMASTVYSNLWGGDGYDSFEMMRQHPDWFWDSYSTSTDWLENWQLMFWHKVPPIHVWPVTNVRTDITEEPIHVHAASLVKGHRDIGWDGVRYDSYYSSTWVKWATDLTRKLVGKEEPDFGWGYNAIMPIEVKEKSLDVMCRGGQLVMEEGLRHVGRDKGSIANYEETLAKYRDILWTYDGHLGICYDGVQTGYDYGGTELDAIYLCCGLLAAGAHPYYGVMDRYIGQFPRFALRYSEYLYNNKMRPLKDPEGVIAFGAPAKLMDWQWLARTVNLGGDRQRLVIHLLNTPVVPNTLSNLAMKLPEPLRQFPVTVKLPPGAKVTGAWALCPIPDAHHEALAPKQAGESVTVIVPEVRIWSVVVLDYTAKDALPIAAPRSITLPPDPQPTQPKPPVVPDPDDVIAQKQGVNPPAEWVFPAAKPLDILAVHGLWYPQYGLDRAFARLGGTRVTDAWYNGGLRFYPDSYEDLMGHHLIVIADVDAAAFGPVHRAQIKRFVEAGGGVLFLGGRIAYRANLKSTDFAEILPITPADGDNRKSAPDGLVLAPGKDALKGFPKLNWAANPRVYWYHDAAPKAGAQVLLTAGGKPLLVAGAFGKGRVVAFLGSVQGVPGAGQTACWEWDGWSSMMAETLNWLAEPATKPAPPSPELLAKMKLELLGPGVKKADKVGPVILRDARIPGNGDTAQMLLKAIGILDGNVPLDLVDAVWDSVRRDITPACEDTARNQLLESAASAKVSLGLRTLGQLKVDGARTLMEDSYKTPGAGGPDDTMAPTVETGVTEDPAVAAYIVRLGALEGLGNLGDAAALPVLQGAVKTYGRQKSKPENNPTEVTKEDELYQQALISALRCGDAGAAGPVVDALLENRYVLVRMTSELDSPDYPGPEHDAERRVKARIRRDLDRVHQRQERLYAQLAVLPANTLAPLAKRLAAEEDPRVAAIAFAIFPGNLKIAPDVQAILKTAKVAAVRELAGTP